MAALVVMRGWAVVGMMALALMGCAHGPEETVVRVPPEMRSPAERPLTPVEVAAARRTTADVVYTIYTQNLFLGATPDQHFRDRPFVVTGVFDGVQPRTQGRTWLHLRTHDEGAFVYAAVGAGARSLPTTLVPGQTVRLLCRCMGAAAGSPLLSDCEQARPAANE